MRLAQFCPACGGALEARQLVRTERTRQVCTQCGRVQYRNAKPCGEALVVREGRCLLVRRAHDPAAGAWDIPGGFLEADEHPEAGAIRELFEETGLEITITGLLGIYLDLYGDDADHVLVITYLATATGEPQPSEEITQVGWFAPHELPEPLAFAHMDSALQTWGSLHPLS